MRTKLLPSLLALSLFLSLPSLIRLPRVLPFLHADVRAGAPKALETLRSQGIWLVNIDLVSIQREESQICFTWSHRYSSREGKSPPEILTTCIDGT
jgi:hypothetical protein